MSRSRNIKPGFFTNEDLVELPFEARLLFIGLWTLADREGRLEDRPKRIKMAIFPADNVDVDASLSALQDSGFIRRYEASGIRCIQVLNFTKHQNPHVREAPSSLPMEGESSASTGPSPGQHCASHADSLIPDSLIPDNPPYPPTPAAAGWGDRDPGGFPRGNGARRKSAADRHRESVAIADEYAKRAVAANLEGGIQRTDARPVSTSVDVAVVDPGRIRAAAR